MRDQRRNMRTMRLCVAALVCVLVGGCGVERTIQIESDPAGALVTLNGMEVGRTPTRKSFVWYGTYDVQLRKEGYQTVSKETKVWAPWWQIPPIDFFAELVPLPLQDKHYAKYTLRPVPDHAEDPDHVVQRALGMRGRLRSSRYTRRPGDPAQTQPATQPATRPATAPAARVGADD